MTPTNPSHDPNDRLITELRATLDKLHEHDIELARVLTIVERPVRMMAESFSPPARRVQAIQQLRKCKRRCNEIAGLMAGKASLARDQSVTALVNDLSFNVRMACEDLELAHELAGNEPELDRSEPEIDPSDWR